MEKKLHFLEIVKRGNGYEPCNEILKDINQPDDRVSMAADHPVKTM